MSLYMLYLFVQLQLSLGAGRECEGDNPRERKKRARGASILPSPLGFPPHAHLFLIPNSLVPFPVAKLLPMLKYSRIIVRR